MKPYFKTHTKLKDAFFLFILCGFVLTIILLLTGKSYIYGSTVDWLSQHSVLPDYFRQTFYSTGNLFPEFSLNLGAGQNAYNFSYYGYLNPIILISYFMPWVSMQNYIIGSSIVIVILSIVIFFYWLKSQNKFRPMVVYVSTILFACSGPLLYHSHMQVMFMDYMPFLLLALIGIDELYKKKHFVLLTVNITLMFLTSYFFAVSAIFILTIYAIYKYLDIYKSDRPSLNTDFNSDIKRPLNFFALRYAFSVTIGIMMACVILLPTFAAIMAGRDSAKAPIKLINLILPRFPIYDFFYTPYGMGALGICLLALLAFAFYDKSKSRNFLGLSILILAFFPLGKFILNGLLYARGKAFIPFLPVVLLITALFLEDLFTKKYLLKRILQFYPYVLILLTLSMIFNGQRDLGYVVIADLILTVFFLYISNRRNKHVFIYVPLTIFAITCCMICNFNDLLIKRIDVKKYYSVEKAEIIDSVISKDPSIYRFSDLCESKFTSNHIYHKRYFSEGGYSSVFNKDYIRFCNYDLSLNNPTVNDISITAANDVLFETFMGVKYIVSNTTAPAGYQLVKKNDNYGIYSSENVYSLGFATKNAMSKNEFMKLPPEERQLAILQYVVVDKNLPNVYTPKLEKVNVKFNLGLKQSKDAYYNVDTLKDRKIIEVPAPDNLKDYIYIIKCNIINSRKTRATIRINGTQNSLSGKDAAYPNKNHDFKFVVSDCSDNKTLQFHFTKGCKFKFSEFEVYRIKYSDVAALKNDVTMMTNISTNDDNIITGNISLDSESYFTTTIPYDKGFNVYVDGIETPYEKTDNAFIGLKLSAGSHNLKFVFHAPFSFSGKVVSLLGMSLLAFMYLKSRSKSHLLNRI